MSSAVWVSVAGTLQWLAHLLTGFWHITIICVYPCLVSGGVTVPPISLSTTLRVSPPTFVTAAAELRRLAAPGAHQLSTNQTAKAFTSPSTGQHDLPCSLNMMLFDDYIYG